MVTLLSIPPLNLGYSCLLLDANGLGDRNY